MSIENLTDIKLNDDWKITQAANGDVPLTRGIECFAQDIQLEAITQEGELFYDTSYGWSLLDFMHRLDDELTIIEIRERIRTKLCQRDIIDANSIVINTEFKDDTLIAYVSFKILGESRLLGLNVKLSRVGVEVITE